MLLIGTILLYNVRSRQLHRHEPLRTMQEWLLWTGLITFGLILVGAIFSFYFLFILLFIVVGLAHVRVDPLLPLPALYRGLQRAVAPRSASSASRATSMPRRRFGPDGRGVASAVAG